MNQGKTAVLIQAHKECLYIKELAIKNPDVNFYIHFDIKSQIDIESYHIIENIHILSERLDVKWGGFSQVQATLNLFKVALAEQENQIFHLISGEDVFLIPFNKISLEIEFAKPAIYMDFRYSLKHKHRTRFYAVHADTSWQRNLLGKILTKFNVLLDKVFYLGSSDLISVYGSQWFSCNRLGIQEIINHLSDDDVFFFKKKLCPDEHFFQFIVEKYHLKEYLYQDNRRYIDLPDNKNHPSYLALPELLSLSGKTYWAARKVGANVALEFLKKVE